MHMNYMFFSKFAYFIYFLVEQSFGPFLIYDNIIEGVVTIFHQANKGNYVVFISMIHLMRYIYFCFNVICIILSNLMN